MQSTAPLSVGCRLVVSGRRQAPPTQSRESASAAPLSDPSSTVADTSPAKPKKSPTEQLREVVERHEAHLAQMQRTTTDAAMAGMEPRLDALRTEFEAKWQKSTADLLARLRREVPGLDEYLTRKLQPSPPPPTVPLLTYDESYKAVPPVNTDEEVQRKLLNQAIEQGYNPATDVLAFAKLEEIRAFDRLAAVAEGERQTTDGEGDSSREGPRVSRRRRCSPRAAALLREPTAGAAQAGDLDSPRLGA
jgi:hypothetical protein